MFSQTLQFLYDRLFEWFNVFFKLILFVVPCISGFTETYYLFLYLFLFPDFKGFNNLC